ncbi:MAG: hypothetical protein ACYCOU_09920 [Sulfobacillus sp.]
MRAEDRNRFWAHRAYAFLFLFLPVGILNLTNIPVSVYSGTDIQQMPSPAKLADLLNRFKLVIFRSLKQQHISFKNFYWLAPDPINPAILALPFSIEVGNRRFVVPLYWINHTYLVTSPNLDIARNYVVVPSIPSPVILQNAPISDSQDRPSRIVDSSKPPQGTSPAQTEPSQNPLSDRDNSHSMTGDNPDHQNTNAQILQKLDSLEAPLRKKKESVPVPSPSSDSDADSPAFRLRPNSHNFALVIGVEHYPGGLPVAEFADRDAHAVTRTLNALGVPLDHIKRLTDETATRKPDRRSLALAGLECSFRFDRVDLFLRS